MRQASRGLIVLATLAALVGLPVKAHAQRAAIQIISAYMTTEPAYNAFATTSPSPRPPKVTVYPVGVANVAVYIDYSGGKPHKTTYRIGFRHNGSEVRHGALHTFGYNTGDLVQEIPADELQETGAYKATLYVDGAATQTIAFSVIKTPSIEKAYMITAQAWDAYDPNKHNAPPRATRIPAGAARVGLYFSYSGMAKADVHYVAVYNASGKLVHRSLDHTAGSFVPDGSSAIILPADAGRYPKGHYRTDLYINGAMVKSVPWLAQ